MSKIYFFTDEGIFCWDNFLRGYIEKNSRVIDIIIAHSGCVVSDMNFQTGRRARSHDKKRVLKRKTVAR